MSLKLVCSGSVEVPLESVCCVSEQDTSSADCLVLDLPRKAGSDNFTLGIKHQHKQIHIQSIALLDKLS